MNARRIPELDGVRGVAILLVVFAHATDGVQPSYRGLWPSLDSLGGFVGVQLFFVLSGFLITRLLLAERERTGALDLLAFYKRRLQRLVPSLVLVSAVAAVVDPWSALRAVTYTANIPVPPNGLGYMGHAWSLAVEEQFYLAWPVLLVLAGSRAWAVALAGILWTVATQQLSTVPDGWIYNLLRWDAILAGCLLALAGMRLRPHWFYAGLAVLVTYTLGRYGTLERLDYPLATLACVGVVGAAVDIKWLGARWLQHVGHISYAWYLWHVLAMRADLPTLVTLPASLVLAEATYWLVDRRAQVRRTSSRQPAVFHVKQEA